MQIDSESKERLILQDEAGENNTQQQPEESSFANEILSFDEKGMLSMRGSDIMPLKSDDPCQ